MPGSSSELHEFAYIHHPWNINPPPHTQLYCLSNQARQHSLVFITLRTLIGEQTKVLRKQNTQISGRSIDRIKGAELFFTLPSFNILNPTTHTLFLDPFSLYTRADPSLLDPVSSMLSSSTCLFSFPQVQLLFPLRPCHPRFSL